MKNLTPQILLPQIISTTKYISWVYFFMLWALALDSRGNELRSLKQFYSCTGHTMWFLLDWAVNWLPAHCSILFSIRLIDISFLQPNTLPLQFHPLLETSLFEDQTFQHRQRKVMVLCCGGLLEVCIWVALSLWWRSRDLLSGDMEKKNPRLNQIHEYPRMFTQV